MQKDTNHPWKLERISGIKNNSRRRSKSSLSLFAHRKFTITSNDIVAINYKFYWLQKERDEDVFFFFLRTKKKTKLRSSCIIAKSIVLRSISFFSMQCQKGRVSLRLMVLLSGLVICSMGISCSEGKKTYIANKKRN